MFLLFRPLGANCRVTGFDFENINFSRVVLQQKVTFLFCINQHYCSRTLSSFKQKSLNASRSKSLCLCNFLPGLFLGHIQVWKFLRLLNVLKTSNDKGYNQRDTENLFSRFRWDYFDIYKDRTGKDLEGFKRFMSAGVRTKYLESVFPAESFPALQTIQTGKNVFRLALTQL